MEIPNLRKLRQIPYNHTPQTEFKDFMKLYKDYTKESFSFLVNNTILPSDNPVRFWIKQSITK